MKKLFWGVFFIYLHFNLNFSGHQVNLLPDFVGYILLFMGIKELMEESACFNRARPFIVGMAVYSAISWFGALFSVVSNGWIASLLTLVAMAVSFYISWLLICGVREMEEKADWGGSVLLSRWKLLLIVQIVTYLLSLAAQLLISGILYTLVALVSIAGIVCIVLYLLAWYRVWNAYERCDREETPAADQE